MARIVRVSLDLVGLRPTEPCYEICVREQVRTATVRDIIQLQCGDAVRPADLEIPLQVLEDVFTAAVSRTIGLALPLNF